MLNRDAFADAVFDYVSDRAFLSNDVSKEFAHLPVEDAVYNSGGIIASRVFEFVPTYRKSPQFKQTPLMLAARYDEQIVSNLILRHADVNEKDCNQRTALHHALNCGKETSALKLIEAGADVEAKDCNQTVALHIAARQGYGKLVCLMIEKGADVNPKDYQKRTPLHFAAEGGHYGSCRALLLNGAKKNVKDKIRKTPLMYTARCVPADEDHSDELEETVWLLLEHGANTKIKDCDGHTAIFGASEKCITAIEDFEEQKK